MTKADLLKLLEPLSDTDIIHCQVNYTTSKTDEAFNQIKYFAKHGKLEDEEAY